MLLGYILGIAVPQMPELKIAEGLTFVPVRAWKLSNRIVSTHCGNNAVSIVTDKTIVGWGKAGKRTLPVSLKHVSFVEWDQRMTSVIAGGDGKAVFVDETGTQLVKDVGYGAFRGEDLHLRPRFDGEIDARELRRNWRVIGFEEPFVLADGSKLTVRNVDSELSWPNGLTQKISLQRIEDSPATTFVKTDSGYFVALASSRGGIGVRYAFVTRGWCAYGGGVMALPLTRKFVCVQRSVDGPWFVTWLRKRRQIKLGADVLASVPGTMSTLLIRPRSASLVVFIGSLKVEGG